MSFQKIELPGGRGQKRIDSLQVFAQKILALKEKTSQKMSSRGWCYFLEGYNLITKGEFDKLQKSINLCRKYGMLPIDMVAEDPKRQYYGVEIPTTISPEAYMKQWLKMTRDSAYYFTPDWWDGEEYYIQMMVEKIDLVNMFKPICEEYHIPIVNAGGWYDILERAQAAERFKAAEANGLKPVILYFGDLDPYGMAISDSLLKGFYDIRLGTKWSPDNLVVDRFGLSYEFIEEQDLTWIDNLESGSGRDMSNDTNRIVTEYIDDYGIRKCEANAIMRDTARDAGLDLCRTTIENYLGDEVLERFEEKRQVIVDRLDKFKKKTGLDKAIQNAIDIINKSTE